MSNTLSRGLQGLQGSSTKPQAAVVTLEIVAPPRDFMYPHRTITLDKKRKNCLIGRTSKATVKGCTADKNNGWFDSPVMSRCHAELSADLEVPAVFIIDSRSTHGTYVNNHRIPADSPTRLATKDEIRFGVQISRTAETYSPTFAIVGIAWTYPDVPGIVCTGTYKLPEETDNDISSVSSDSAQRDEVEGPRGSNLEAPKLVEAPESSRVCTLAEPVDRTDNAEPRSSSPKTCGPNMVDITQPNQALPAISDNPPVGITDLEKAKSTDLHDELVPGLGSDEAVTSAVMPGSLPAEEVEASSNPGQDEIAVGVTEDPVESPGERRDELTSRRTIMEDLDKIDDNSFASDTSLHDDEGEREYDDVHDRTFRMLDYFKGLSDYEFTDSDIVSNPSISISSSHSSPKTAPHNILSQHAYASNAGASETAQDAEPRHPSPSDAIMPKGISAREAPISPQVRILGERTGKAEFFEAREINRQRVEASRREAPFLRSCDSPPMSMQNGMYPNRPCMTYSQGGDEATTKDSGTGNLKKIPDCSGSLLLAQPVDECTQITPSSASFDTEGLSRRTHVCINELIDAEPSEGPSGTPTAIPNNHCISRPETRHAQLAPVGSASNLVEKSRNIVTMSSTVDDTSNQAESFPVDNSLSLKRKFTDISIETPEDHAWASGQKFPLSGNNGGSDLIGNVHPGDFQSRAVEQTIPEPSSETEERPRKRQHRNTLRLIEIAGYTILGAVSASIGLIVALIATAPDLD